MMRKVASLILALSISTAVVGFAPSLVGRSVPSSRVKDSTTSTVLASKPLFYDKDRNRKPYATPSLSNMEEDVWKHIKTLDYSVFPSLMEYCKTQLGDDAIHVTTGGPITGIAYIKYNNFRLIDEPEFLKMLEFYAEEGRENSRLVVIDVREPEELQKSSRFCSNQIDIPLSEMIVHHPFASYNYFQDVEFESRFQFEAIKESEAIVLCGGVRSTDIAMQYLQYNFSPSQIVYVYTGGAEEWFRDVDMEDLKKLQREFARKQLKKKTGERLIQSYDDEGNEIYEYVPPKYFTH